MRVLILGIDGYIGWSLALHLLKKGHEVWGLDDGSRRMNVKLVGSDSLTPIIGWPDRIRVLRNYRGYQDTSYATLGEGTADGLLHMLAISEPQAIFHLAEQPSAPFSMRSSVDAALTQRRNVVGTLQLLWGMYTIAHYAHLIKLGTMGEYGTPDCVIPEGRVPDYPCACSDLQSQECPMRGLLFPRTAGSFYHLSKVMDTLNVEFACRNWGLTSTDIMQGVVFGLNEYDSMDEITRFDYDEHFGTIINRFCVEALIGHPLTPYGAGGQTRGYLPLKDSIQCLEIAMMNPPAPGEYRTLNQFDTTYSVNQLADTVARCADQAGLKASVKHITNPRKEKEKHRYDPIHETLFKLGYKPTGDIEQEITRLIAHLAPYTGKVKKEVILPKTTWF